MDKTVRVAGRKYKAATKLKRIFAQAVLAHTNGFGAFASASIVSAQEMKQVGFLEAHGLICLALVINEKREGDAGLLAEVAGITHIAQTDGGQTSAFPAKFLFKFAQLRDVLPAEDSTVMAKKDDDRGCITPERAQPDRFAIDIRKREAGESGAVSLSHGASFSWAADDPVKTESEFICVGDSGRVARFVQGTSDAGLIKHKARRSDRGVDDARFQQRSDCDYGCGFRNRAGAGDGICSTRRAACAGRHQYGCA